MLSRAFFVSNERPDFSLKTGRSFAQMVVYSITWLSIRFVVFFTKQLFSLGFQTNRFSPVNNQLTDFQFAQYVPSLFIQFSPGVS